MTGISVASRLQSLSIARALLAFGFALLIGLGAHLKLYLPFTPVPMTFQTFFLLVGAAYLRRFYSLQMIAWYLLLGFVGFPLFANPSAGVAYLLGPTAGYLFGFVIAAALLGFFEVRRVGGQFLFFVFCHTLIFLPGVAWLKIVTDSSWSRALEMGFYPFLLGDLLKSASAFLCWVLFITPPPRSQS